MKEKKWLFTVWITLLLMFLSLPNLTLAEEPLSSDNGPSLNLLTNSIPEFTRISDDLYRGGQPTEMDLKLLKDFGIKTIVCFRNEKNIISWEQPIVEKLGMTFVSLPWKIQSQTDPELMKKFLDLIDQTDKGPIYFHCKRGVERTGVANAVYFYYHEKLSENEAYNKAMKGHNRLWYWRLATKKRYKEFLKALGPG